MIFNIVIKSNISYFKNKTQTTAYSDRPHALWKHCQKEQFQAEGFFWLPSIEHALDYIFGIHVGLSNALWKL